MAQLARFGTMLAAAATFILSGCGNPPAEGGTAASQTTGTAEASTRGNAGQVEFWHYFTGEHEKAFRALMDKFEQENPGIKVRTVYQGNPQQLSQKLSSALAAMPANNPVISTVYENWTSDYVARDYLDAVENHFDGPAPFSEQEKKDVVSAFVEANQYDGKWVTIPFNKSIYLLYYNADMLAKAGFPEPPKTLDEFRDAVIKTTVRDGRRTSTFGFGTMPASEAFTTLFFASGGEMISADGKAAFNNEVAVKCLETLRGLLTGEKYIYVASEYMSNPLGNEQIAMFIYSSASFPFTEKAVGDRFKWAVAPIPGSGDGPPKYVMQGTNVAIFKNHSDEQREAAWKICRFLLQTENCVFWATRSGYMPIRYSMLEHPEMKAYMEQNPQYGVASNLVLTDMGKQEPKIAVWEGIRTDLTNMVDRVLAKGADPAAELAEAAELANKRLTGAAK